MPTLSYLSALGEDHLPQEVPGVSQGLCLLANSPLVRPARPGVAGALLRLFGEQDIPALPRRPWASAFLFGGGPKKCCCMDKGYLVAKAGVTSCENPSKPSEYHQHPTTHTGENCKCGSKAANAKDIKDQAQQEADNLVDRKMDEIRHGLEKLGKDRGVHLKEITRPKNVKVDKLNEDFLCCCASGEKGQCTYSDTCMTGHWVTDNVEFICGEAKA
mmetsp:Transcript_78750/g.222638  ORF Transcript_78750/g.222638 Transcript_78750/m.222638 type:complete len:216 (-) Transcript_78750:268-915(-)